MTTQETAGGFWGSLEDNEPETELDTWHREQAEQAQARRDAYRARTGHLPTPTIDMDTYDADDDGLAEYGEDI